MNTRSINDRGTRSKILDEVKPVKNINKNLKGTWQLCKRYLPNFSQLEPTLHQKREMKFFKNGCNEEDGKFLLEMGKGAGIREQRCWFCNGSMENFFSSLAFAS